MNKSLTMLSLLVSLFFIGCAGQPLPTSVVQDIENTYDGIQSYSAEIENRLDGDRFDVDQEWYLSVQKPDKYKRVVVKINDEELNPPAVEICDGSSYYSSESGNTETYSCENLVKETFGIIEKLNVFSSDLYDSAVTPDGGNYRVEIAFKGQQAETEIWVDGESYLIERVRYRTPQADGSTSIRTEVYKNVRLNQNFGSDEFKIP